MNRSETRKLIDRNRVVTLKADRTHEDPEIDAMLRELGNPSAAIPYYAVFPAERPRRPIVFGELIRQRDVANALKQAGPSLPQSTAAVMPFAR